MVRSQTTVLNSHCHWFIVIAETKLGDHFISFESSWLHSQNAGFLFNG